jgi:hypothetical protein
MADSIAKGNGFLTVCSIIPESDNSPARIKSFEETVSAFLEKKQITGLVKVVSAPNILTGSLNLLQMYGFGPLVPNTVLIGLTDDPKRSFIPYATFIKNVASSRRNIVIMKELDELATHPGIKRENEGRIDVWWGGRTNSGALMLSLAYLMRKNPTWAKTTLTVKTIVRDTTEMVSSKIKLDSFIAESRLNATSKLVKISDNDIFKTICDDSSDAALVLLGMRAPLDDESVEEYAEYCKDLTTKTSSLQRLVKVLAAEDIDFQRIFK